MSSRTSTTPVRRSTKVPRLRARRGTFPNGMTYVRFGDGPKTLLWIAAPTSRLMLRTMKRAVRPFVADEYTVFLVSGMPGMPRGHTLADMAEDYATLIDAEFDGRVDVVIGHSTGGIIGFAIAAEHPDRFGRIVIGGAGLWVERSDRANLEMARLLVAGRTREAGAQSVRLLMPDMRIPGAASVIGAVMARASLVEASAEDLLVSAEALHGFEPQELLPRIGVPLMLVAGDEDMWFPPEAVEQAARLIPDCVLRLYPGKNHFAAITSAQFAADAREFIRTA